MTRITEDTEKSHGHSMGMEDALTERLRRK